MWDVSLCVGEWCVRGERGGEKRILVCEEKEGKREEREFDVGDSIAIKVERVYERIAAACARSGRNSSEVQLVAATKKIAPEKISEAVDAGISVVGENRVQEAIQKKELCPGHLEWHMIGHLQRNKIRHALELFDFIHSVDSLRVLDAIEAEAEKKGRTVPVCLEINLAGESTKYGFGREEFVSVLEHCCGLSRVEVRGLMTMPPFTVDSEDVRHYFAELRNLRDEGNERTGMRIEGLSMGMSHDYEVAVEEGATWVRVGSAIFGERRPESL